VLHHAISRQTGSVLGVALFGSLLANGFLFGARLALVVSAALLIIAAAVIVLGDRKRA
jgi:MFS transporter, DHA2 family, methylenomycin A resistance protein